MTVRLLGFTHRISLVLGAKLENLKIIGFFILN